MGGIFGTDGRLPGHAVFYILVADVEATCADAEQLGGSVIGKHLDPGLGAPKFAYLRDPSGNQFGVFSPPVDPFAPAGRVFGEWVSIPTIDRDLWQSVLAEAVDFARESLSDQG